MLVDFLGESEKEICTMISFLIVLESSMRMGWYPCTQCNSLSIRLIKMTRPLRVTENNLNFTYIQFNYNVLEHNPTNDKRRSCIDHALPHHSKPP
jgi:hypothetical protein